MSSASDSGMMKMMGLVAGALVILALMAMLTANILSNDAVDPTDRVLLQAQRERIQPVASVRTSADDLPGQQAAAGGAAAAGAVTPPEEIVAGACSACHQSGVAGAPLSGDEAVWAERRAAGLDALVASVINGKGAMPARAGTTYSDDELRGAVQLLAMFEVSEEESTDDGSAAAASEGETATTESAAPADDNGGDAAEAPADSAATPAAEQATAEADTGSAEATAATVAALASTDVPDDVKSVVDSVCAACHIAGLAGAPKFGDEAAWNERLANGFDSLVQSVINGKGAMPARGGSSLTDEQVPAAIHYMLSK